jgi:S1-C subfamily serine protease
MDRKIFRNMTIMKGLAIGATIGGTAVLGVGLAVNCSSVLGTHDFHKYPSEGLEERYQKALESVEQSMVKINCYSSDGNTSGSGVIFRTFSNGDSYILTANHVMGYNRNCYVMKDFQNRQLKMESRYDAADIAVVSGNLPNINVYSLPFSFDVKSDQDIVSMGFRDDSVYLSFGHIIGVEKPQIQGSTVEHYRIHAYIRPGNSGGPVTDDKGNIIGVNISRDLTYVRVGTASAANNLRSQLEIILKSPDRPSIPVIPVPKPAESATISGSPGENSIAVILGAICTCSADAGVADAGVPDTSVKKTK